MKTYKNLFDSICSFENLYLAARKAQKGKRFKNNVAQFNMNLEKEILRLQRQLQQQTYQPEAYESFYIYEPKKRLISKAPYHDRVVHHALCNVIEPIFENSFIFDSYANQKGKGTHRAVLRFQQYLRRYRYVLKCDIKKYFPSIDHEILKGIIRKKIADQKTLWLIDAIIDNSNPQEPVLDYFPGDDLLTPAERRRGLPIGNLTSQFFANVYLNDFDHFVKEQLHCQAYLRYVDDFATLANDKFFLHDVKWSMEQYLSGLRVKLHPNKCHIFLSELGVDFLGYRVFPTHRKLRMSNVLRFRRRFKKMAEKYRQGRITLTEVNASVQSWLGHARFADTYQLRRSIFKQVKFKKN
jgi:retron-type reverse transcriptase